MFYKETEYALRGLVYIQVQNNIGRKPGTGEISKEIAAPYFYTAKILQRLVKCGYILSIKGKGGGFYFDNTKSNLTIKELINAVEGDKTFSGCGFGLKNCSPDNPCPLHNQYAPIREVLVGLLSSETIQSLAVKYTEHNLKFTSA